MVAPNAPNQSGRGGKDRQPNFYELPGNLSAADYSYKKLPPRVDDNVDGADGYARWYKYPTSSASLIEMIDLAFGARTIKAHLIDNTRERKLRNSSCTP